MKPLANNRTAKTLLGSLATAALLVTALDVQAAVSQSPLSLTVGVPPNIILTLDESGSMSWGFVPDSIEDDVLINRNNNYTITRLYAASEFNAMYYNPGTKYVIPPFFDENGSEVKLTTQFTKAPINGFRPGDGTVDLSNNYRPTGKEYRMPNGTHQRASNPGNDFSVSISFSRNETKTETSDAGISFKVTRSGNNYTCSIEKSGPVLSTSNFSCSRSSNTYTVLTPAYYYVFDENLAGCSTSTATSNSNCYKLVFVKDDEKENFATWYSFYRTRALATLSATSLAFSQLSTSARLGWQNLALCTSLNGGDTKNCKDNKFREYDAQHKGQFYSWLKDVYFNSGTPLPAAMKRAGEFLKESVAWQKYPNSRNSANKNTADNTYACRPSYHILMTDGMWNATTSNPSPFRHDGANITLPDGKNYTGQRPYQDNTSSTLADLAMHYWATDLNPNLENKLTPYLADKSGTDEDNYWNPKNDPASWQHMSNFIMGLGLGNSLKQKGIEWDSEKGTFGGSGYNNLLTGTASWPAASSNSQNNVYDLWHAAVNSRGEFFSADSPEAMIQAFDDILSRISDRKSSAARPAISSGQVSEDEQIEGRIVTVSYQSTYASDESWSGDLKRVEKGWSAENNQYETFVIWSAENKVPAAANRKIYIASETETSGLQAFTEQNAGLSGTTDSLAYHLNRDPENGNIADGRWQSRLNYLRGDRSLEDSTMRKRHSVLGDFYASSPVAVSGPRYLRGFANKLEQSHGDNTYTAFAESIATRTPRVYIGGNDGMLHGFNARTGIEEFAFIPTAVFPKLNKLTGRNYSHEFYVDGTPVVADVFDGSQWRTVLVGTLRAGGKSVFALDITRPGQEKLLWEFDDSDIPDNDVKMGYSFSQPTIARLHTGKWAVVFGNGYEAAGNGNGKAALFIVDALSGELKKSLEVSGTANVPNGLSTPRLADYNGDGVADYAYAGDLQGNLWRFDLLRNNREQAQPFTTADDGENALGDFEVGYGGKPLFKAEASNNARQPITAPPSLIQHPTNTGYLVVFGTGKFFEDGDKDGDKSMAQTVYGIWDRQTRGEDTAAITISRSSLTQQTIEATVTTDGTPARVITGNNVPWTTNDRDGNMAINQYGWYLDLRSGALEGEMVIEPMVTLGRTLFFQSLIPNTDPCADGANNWTYAINPYTGGHTAQNAFGLTPVTIGQDSRTVSAIRQDGEGGLSAGQNQDQSFELCTGLACVPVFPDPSSMGRQTWRTVTTQ
ncbi:pilus assembly protein [Stutzerimonas azotifigens]|uniref:pilus assembly protein n=1 Tax=Stutzerimonas azotifigens TaxID=291995 RepID=UPI00048233B3|nr:PilC/PilY family type IV pilus protein [Stutzerimonas azotifigens]